MKKIILIAVFWGIVLVGMNESSRSILKYTDGTQEYTIEFNETELQNYLS